MLASIESKEYITNGELEVDDASTPVNDVSGCKFVPMGDALAVTASRDMVSRMPNAMPLELFMVFSTHLLSACTILKLSNIIVLLICGVILLCSCGLEFLFNLFGFVFFDSFLC